MITAAEITNTTRLDPHLTSSPITRAYMICREFRRRSYKSTYQTQIMTYDDFSNLTIQGIIFFNIFFWKWKSTIFVHVLKPLIRNSDSYLSRLAAWYVYVGYVRDHGTGWLPQFSIVLVTHTYNRKCPS